jgi:SAM domain (Sterile alpha motif)
VPSLTTEDLEGLGVAAIGHRRRLLVAIAKLQEEAASPQAVRPTDENQASTSAGERRQLMMRWLSWITVQACAAWFDALPASLRDNATAAALQEMIDLDLDAIARDEGPRACAEIQPPLGDGRD